MDLKDYPKDPDVAGRHRNLGWGLGSCCMGGCKFGLQCIGRSLEVLSVCCVRVCLSVSICLKIGVDLDFPGAEP